MEKPIILNLKNKKDKQIFRNLINKKVKIIDLFENQVRELCAIKKIKFSLDKVKMLDRNSLWIYYPWRNALMHILDKKNFRLVRLSRNAILIDEKEQKKLPKFRIGAAGLNVGGPVVLGLILQGFEKFKIADNDVFELANLNRFAAGLNLFDVGVNKTISIARHAYEIDPFINIETFENGLNENNLEEFLVKNRVDILIEEMDNLKLKIKIREVAKRYRIPVVMATGNGPNVIVDVERFDLSPNLPLLSGFLKQEVINKIFSDKEIQTIREKALLARDFMGKEFLIDRLNKAFNLIGKKIIGIPQISEVSFLRAGVLVYVIREILLNKKIKSGRYLFETTKIFQKPISKK